MFDAFSCPLYQKYAGIIDTSLILAPNSIREARYMAKYIHIVAKQLNFLLFNITGAWAILYMHSYTAIASNVASYNSYYFVPTDLL